ncbi:MAG: ASCH domain-containing protein [Candidatus Kapaibacterium sp.]
MNAISIQQPYAELIATGVKDIENRNWSTPFRGNILIHASRKFDTIGLHDVQQKYGVLLGKTEKDFATGGIIGMTTITDCVLEHESPWFCGKFGFVLTNSMSVPFLPCLGKLGIFDCTDYDLKYNTAPPGFDEDEFFELAAFLEYDAKFPRHTAYSLAKIELQQQKNKRLEAKRQDRLFNKSLLQK